MLWASSSISLSSGGSFNKAIAMLAILKGFYRPRVFVLSCDRKKKKGSIEEKEEETTLSLLKEEQSGTHLSQHVLRSILVDSSGRC